MSCEHGENAVESALEDVDGIDTARADHESGEVTIEGEASAAAIETAVAEAGYEATV